MKHLLTFLLTLAFVYHATAQPCTGSTHYQSQTICEGTVYQFYSQQLTAAGQYNDTIILAGGCDSIISLQLFVIPSVYSYDTALLCGGSYDFYGVQLTQPGTYYDTLFAIA